MRAPSVPVVTLALLVLMGVASLVPGRLAEAKDPKGKAPVGPPKTGTFQLPAAPPVKYILMSVPKDYDPAKYYPLLFVLHPMSDDSKGSEPEAFIGAWGEVLSSKGWILASPACPLYDNEASLSPIMDSLKRVREAYKIDDRRTVIVGHNAGAMMAWRVFVTNPKEFSAIVALSGEVPQQDRSTLKSLAGKSAYIFRGSKDTYYTEAMLKTDTKYLEFAKVVVKAETKADWGLEFPRESAPEIAKWIDAQWPPGAYREKADAVEKALAAKDLAASATALRDLGVELRKAPYPAFSARLLGYIADYEGQGRSLIEAAAKMVEADPLGALAQMEGALKALKGQPPLEGEATKALAALKKAPAVVEALRKKEAEAQASSYMEKAAALEAKGDLGKALEAFKKAAALDSSRKEEAQKKVAELEPKVGGG